MQNQNIIIIIIKNPNFLKKNPIFDVKVQSFSEPIVSFSIFCEVFEGAKEQKWLVMNGLMVI